MQHTHTLKEAWHLTRRYKKLWLLGLFASFFGGGIAETFFIAYDNLSSSGERTKAIIKTLQGIDLQSIVSHIVQNIQTAPLQAISWFFLTVLFLCVIAAILWLIAMAETALIRAIPIIQQGKNIALTQLIVGIQRATGKVLAIQALRNVIVLFLVIVTGSLFMGILTMKEPTISILFSLFLVFVVSIILHLLLSVLSLYTMGAIVIHQKTLKEGIQRGFKLFRENWEFTIEMALLLFVIEIISSITALLFFIIVTIPFALFLSLSIVAQHVLLVTLSLSLIGFIITGGLIFFRAVFTAYQITCWMLLYQYLPKNLITRRLFHHITHR